MTCGGHDGDADGLLRIGQTVFHTKFGEGVITTLEGQGNDARAQMNFGRHGSKWWPCRSRN